MPSASGMSSEAAHSDFEQVFVIVARPPFPWTAISLMGLLTHVLCLLILALLPVLQQTFIEC